MTERHFKTALPGGTNPTFFKDPDPRTEAARRDMDPSKHGQNNRAWFVAGAEWQAAQEPTEDDAHTAWEEWNRHLARYVKPGVIRCYCGEPAFWGTTAAHEQHALWHALRAVRRDEEKR